MNRSIISNPPITSTIREKVDSSIDCDSFKKLQNATDNGCTRGKERDSLGEDSEVKDREVPDDEDLTLDLEELSPEVMEYARRELGENDEVKCQTLHELREMIYGNLKFYMQSALPSLRKPSAKKHGKK